MVRNAEQIDSTIDVVTPENIAFQYQAAGPFRRMPAFLIDMAIEGAVLVGILFSLSFFAFFAPGLGFAFFLLALFIIPWFYGGIFETYWNGQTPGKRMMGIRVLTVDGQPINGLQAVMRNVLRAVDIMPLVPWPFMPTPPVLPTFMMGVIVPMLNRRYQRLGDLVCGTMVIVEERNWLMGVAKIEDDRAAQLAEWIPPGYQVSRSLARCLSTYVERRKFFSTARRREIARHVAEPLLEQFNLPRDTSYDLLLCALYHRTFIADRADAARNGDGANGTPPPPAPPNNEFAVETGPLSSRVGR
jgi:uncharacterized RDD family membrane protein YckC